MRHFFRFISIALFAGFAIGAEASDWLIDKKNSKITVAGTHAGNPFELVFADYEIAITFDAADLSSASIRAELNTASAKTGNMMYDGTLGQPEWLDSATYDKIVFASTDVRATDDAFAAHGTITLKGKTLPYVLTFTLQPAGAQTRATANAKLDRFELDVGMTSDPSASWVSQQLTLSLDLLAAPN